MWRHQLDVAFRPFLYGSVASVELIVKITVEECGELFLEFILEWLGLFDCLTDSLESCVFSCVIGLAWIFLLQKLYDLGLFVHIFVNFIFLLVSF